ncbi:MAG: PD40 domain-containing protein [Thermoleophilia bacterium]|nr:PD40 domain-containing protein [Thermoleophilia bacterium]
MQLRNLLIVGAVVALAGFALADALLGTRPSSSPRAPTAAATTGARATQARLQRFPATRAPGSVVFVDGAGCRLRQVVASSGSELPLPPVETACRIWAPRRGVRIAYRLPGIVGEAVAFQFLDLNHPRQRLGGWRALYGSIAWSPDGQRAAWCAGPTFGFDHELGGRLTEVEGCPREYGRDGTVLVVSGSRILGGHRLLVETGGRIGALHRGSDGSLAALVDDRIEVFRGSRLVRERRLRPGAGSPLVFSPDNCAVLAFRDGTAALLDLGCFRGRDAVVTVSPDNCVDRSSAVTSLCARYPVPRAFAGHAGAWSPDGRWIALAEGDAIAFHRVVGRYAAVRWRVSAADLAWLA